jgi:hypothetical protein
MVIFPQFFVSLPEGQPKLVARSQDVHIAGREQIKLLAEWLSTLSK